MRCSRGGNIGHSALPSRRWIRLGYGDGRFPFRRLFRYCGFRLFLGSFLPFCRLCSGFLLVLLSVISLISFFILVDLIPCPEFHPGWEYSGCAGILFLGGFLSFPYFPSYFLYPCPPFLAITLLYRVFR